MQNVGWKTARWACGSVILGGEILRQFCCISATTCEERIRSMSCSYVYSLRHNLFTTTTAAATTTTTTATIATTDVLEVAYNEIAKDVHIIPFYVGDSRQQILHNTNLM